MLAKIASRNNVLWNIAKSKKKNIDKIEPMGDCSGKVWLGSSGILYCWPSIVEDISICMIDGSCAA